MKSIAFVDLHGSRQGFKELEQKLSIHSPKILLCAGDITIFETDIEDIIKKLDKFGKLMLIIHGNHESEETMEKLCKRSKNLHFLHKGYTVIDDVLFIGFGGGGFSLRDEEFEEFAKKMEKIIQKEKNHRSSLKTVLLIHGPPYKTKVDHIYDGHAGNKSYLNFIKKNKIDYVFCGHLHENSGKEDKIGNTRIINPGPHGKFVILE